MKKLFIFLFCIVGIGFSQEMVAVSFCWETRCYESFISARDTAMFTHAISAKEFSQAVSFLNGKTKIYENSHLSAEGMYDKGNWVNKWYLYKVNPPYDLYSIEHYNDQSECLKTEYYENGKKARTEYPRVNDFFQSFVEDYQLGIQPPIMISGTYPTGLTLSSLNFHTDLLMPMPSYGSRVKLVLASEVGTKGFGLRAGLAPLGFDEKRVWGFTPLTLNASFTKLWKGSTYSHFDPVVADQWYAGGDLDWSGMIVSGADTPIGYVLGALHLRAGVIAPLNNFHKDNVQFGVSVGMSPGIIGWFFGGAY